MAIISGDIIPANLPTLGPMDLASSQLKKMREQREQKYMKEQVLLEGELNSGMVIAKTHKGFNYINSRGRQ